MLNFKSMFEQTGYKKKLKDMCYVVYINRCLQERRSPFALESFSD